MEHHAGWPLMLAVLALTLLLGACTWAIRRQPHRSAAEMLAYAFGHGLLLALMTRVAGPYTALPALLCVVTMSAMPYPSFRERPWLLVALMLASFAAPLALAWSGHAEALVAAGQPTVVMLVGAALARTNRRAQQQLVIQAWHLRQLLPPTTSPS